MSSLLKQVVVLGSTGSIGLSTLDVISQHPDRFKVFALVANRSVDAILKQCLTFSPEYVALMDGASARKLEHHLIQAGSKTQVVHSMEDVARIVSHVKVDCVMAAIVGAAGLIPTLAAAKAGKRILLANKEALVMAGELFMSEVQSSGAELLPIDSEHNAIFQCLGKQSKSLSAGSDVLRILLTASGGPFRGRSLSQLRDVTPEQAVAHPNWSMGRKISVDSATLMNKGLELIEACWLFDVAPARVEVHVHPESIIHSMVEYVDGSVLAQMGAPDMRTPIAYGLAYPDRVSANVASLDFFKLGRLTFHEPDHTAFPSLKLAAQAFMAGGCASTVLNAANEVAVQAFLDLRIPFTHIPELVERALSEVSHFSADSLSEILECDRATRTEVLSWVSGYQGGGR